MIGLTGPLIPRFYPLNLAQDGFEVPEGDAHAQLVDEEETF